MAQFGFFSCKKLKFCVTSLKFCTQTPFSIAHKRKKRVDQVHKYFARKRQKFKKWKIKILQKSLNKAIFWKKVEKFPHTTGNNSPYAYSLEHKILGHCPNYKTQKNPLISWNKGPKILHFWLPGYNLCRYGQTL